MNTIKKILVPVDFSPGAAHALEYAVDLSLRYDAELTLVHVNEFPANLMPSTSIPPSVIERWIAETNDLLASSKTQALGAGARHVQTEFLQGVPHLEIVRLAADRNFDLIVLGTHGRTGLKHALIGSVAERVVRTAPCPVLAVRLTPPAASKRG